jgi:proteasome lid subunit RPN8/RPN11
MNIELITLLAIQGHVKKEYPRESCGLIQIFKGKQRYIPCRNEAEGSEHFYLSAADYARAEDDGEIVAIVHSHPDTAPLPSQADKVSCEKTGLPWLIVNWPTGKHHIHYPEGYVAPLVGREFVFGVLDCYSLIQDHFSFELNITLPDFERRDEFWKRDENLYLDHYKEAGFVEVSRDDLQANDVAIMRIESASIPEHGGVILEDGRILHHVANRLSSRDVYGQYYRNRTVAVVRHEAFL